jgi:hypothetical protein
MTLILRAGTLVLLASLVINFSSPAAWGFDTGFETPTYVSGALAGQDSWTGSSVARVQTQAELDTELTAAGLNPADSVHSGSQAVIVTGTGGSSATIRAFSGFESATRAVFDVWARPLTPGASGSSVGTNLGNIFIVTEDADGASGRAAAFRFGATVEEGVLQATSIDALSAGSTWLPTGIAWQPDTWYNLRLDADYSTKTYDVFVDGAQVLDDIAFVHAGSTHLNQIRVFRGSGQAGMIVDDLAAFVPEPSALALLLAAGSVLPFRRRR